MGGDLKLILASLRFPIDCDDVRQRRRKNILDVDEGGHVLVRVKCLIEQLAQILGLFGLKTRLRQSHMIESI